MWMLIMLELVKRFVSSGSRNRIQNGANGKYTVPMLWKDTNLTHLPDNLNMALGGSLLEKYKTTIQNPV